jgi:tetratricopeptide (TPR) repeat protein
MKRIFSVLLFSLSVFFSPYAKAQNPTKDAMNAFAHFSKTQDSKQLLTARKSIDEVFKTRRDSVSPRNNLIKAMIYSVLAVVDSNRNFSYQKDPLQEASYSLSLLNNDKFRQDHEPEIEFIKNQLARGYLFEAENALGVSNLEEAAYAFTRVDTLSPGNLHITHNLAILYEKLGYPDRAIHYYKKLIAERPEPAYYFNLSELYSNKKIEKLALETLQQGRREFPKYKDLVFKEINYFAEKQDYHTVISLLPNAIKLDENSIPLNYLAGFSYDLSGNVEKAAEHYEKLLNSDPNNYDGNYALGLLNLNSFVKNPGKRQFMYTALHHLSKANEIDPNQLKTLQSLAILYQYSGDEIQLQRVNNKINQLKLN